LQVLLQAFLCFVSDLYYPCTTFLKYET
jgi:hypothetical protein